MNKVADCVPKSFDENITTTTVEHMTTTMTSETLHPPHSSQNLDSFFELYFGLMFQYCLDCLGMNTTLVHCFIFMGVSVVVATGHRRHFYHLPFSSPGHVRCLTWLNVFSTPHLSGVIS